ncbi:amidohydrolase/deacetylase family metallohydrolase [Nostoc sp. FACHB-110]|uniref:amidohydrolase/deacetylase family metallohydrolase n=1 Tax=Nostoc sp. FACHB-110 TaxID=2692834 RepID=UPI001683AA4E|nr:amidohydrolase/deacetylase family metallohydrolase [Nostoc sp. FACHB-110]MBD2439017.1 amidohydrolase/deacetylase family metallohydrolase [Nostoc sp. FACHB-110]
MHTQLNSYDLVLKNGWVIDPSQSLNGRFDVAICDGKIAAIAEQLPPYETKQEIAASQYLICPGFIDLHVHVYEWATTFGVAADDVGINAGVTTIVDQGSSSPFTFAGFQSEVIAKSKTDVRSFLLVNHAANQTIGSILSGLESPQKVKIETLIKLAQANPQIVRGFKVHADSGSISRWGMGVLALARQIGDQTNLPLYVHTGELFPVVEANRPNPEKLVENALTYMKAGDILGHCYSCQPDGLMGIRTQIPQWLLAAIEQGILLDLGHGLKFSFAVARRMLAQGVFPDTISSDAHGSFKNLHDDSTLTYSLCGAISKLVALGLDLEKAIAAVTLNPARVLKAETELGTLKVGSIADISILQLVEGEWCFFDALEEKLVAQQKLIPVGVVRSGEFIQPSGRFLRDLVARASA